MKIWWQRPLLRTDEDEEKERKATWLELFYDLVFVAVIAQLSHKLSADVSWNGVLVYAFLFVPVWWLWIGSTYYNERFEVNDVRHRLLTFLAMLPVAALAVTTHDALGVMSRAFALAYVAGRILLIYMWLSAGKAQDKWTHATTRRYAIGFSISVCFWLISLFVSIPFRFVLWGLGLFIDLVTPVTTLNLQARMPKLSTSHLPERFGLFMILAIAETVIGVVSGAAKVHHLSLANGIVALLGLFLAFVIWWVYFDHVMYRPFKHRVWYIAAWSYLHLPLLIGITAIGAGVINIVSCEGNVVTAPIRWLLCGAVALILLVMGIIGMLCENRDHAGHVHLDKNINQHMLLLKGIVALIVLAIGYYGTSLSPVTFLLLLIAMMFIQLIHGLYLWVKVQL